MIVVLIESRVHMVPQIYDRRRYVSAHVRQFVGVVLWMHIGKDGRVRQLCVLGITHLL
jgi:hypothetical protein